MKESKIKNGGNTTTFPRRFQVELDERLNGLLEKIRGWYRSPSDSHTVRLMIEDVAKGIESGDLISRFRVYPEGSKIHPAEGVQDIPMVVEGYPPEE